MIFFIGVYKLGSWFTDLSLESVIKIPRNKNLGAGWRIGLPLNEPSTENSAFIVGENGELIVNDDETPEDES